ncbi:MAG: 2-succinyl-5-enolpyruvyl-6-hydroxy-3-cyclohexene-1-carboxylic-acid synthase, partial [Microcystaceae cyanobacterium]
LFCGQFVKSAASTAAPFSHPGASPHSDSPHRPWEYGPTGPTNKRPVSSPRSLMDYQLDYRTVNTLWSSVLAETLARLGLETAVLCPGSRSSPLTLALAQHPRIHTLAILDERSAAFFALGRARYSQKPVVLVCTSGTAAANFFPAIIEAKESQVPLIVLTGDRPPELRHCHAGQTIDQVKLYGHYPQWQTELAPPAADPEQLRYLRQTLVYAWERSLLPQKGVVHVNCPFREPLAPMTQDQDFPMAIAPVPETHPFQTVQPVNPSPLLSTLPVLPTFPTKGMIIAGLYQGAEPEQYCRHIQQLSQALSYPVLGEALSPVRNYFRRDYPLISHYDWGLRNAALAEVLTPEIVIQIGELPTSKVLRHWLAGLPCPRYIITDSQENFDPLHAQSYHLRTSLGALLETLLANLA